MQKRINLELVVRLAKKTAASRFPLQSLNWEENREEMKQMLSEVLVPARQLIWGAIFIWRVAVKVTVIHRPLELKKRRQGRRET